MWILITGASSGIGEACAKAFAEKGHNLILLARRIDRLEKISRKLCQSKKSIEVHCFQMDVTKRADLFSLIKNEKKLFSKADVLVNNAGLAKGLSAFQDSDPAAWDMMIDTNIKGLLNITKAMIPLFLAKSPKNPAHIVNIGSVAGHYVYPKGHVYCATKHAVKALNEGLRMDLMGTGIRVTSIDPGMVETEFSEVRLGDKKAAKAVYVGMTPLRATDVADAVTWAVERPKHVNIQEMILYPTDQASPTLVSRRPV